MSIQESLRDPRALDQKLVQPDRTVKSYPPAGATYTLEELQKAVDGYIEMVRLPDDYIMWVNEDGLSRLLPFNPVASDLAGQPIVGTVLICRDELVE